MLCGPRKQNDKDLADWPRSVGRCLMRLSGLVIATVLFVSATLLAQRGGGSSSGGASSAGSSHASSGGSAGGSLGSTSARSSSSSSGRTGPATSASNARTHAPESSAKPEKRSFFSSLWHKKEPPKSASVVPARSCAKRAVFNGFSCGLPYVFNDCGALANQLAAQRRHMQGQSDPGQALIYRLLREQYESCALRHPGFGADNSAFLFDAP
jgi:hypothetical protein